MIFCVLIFSNSNKNNVYPHIAQAAKLWKKVRRLWSRGPWFDLTIDKRIQRGNVNASCPKLKATYFVELEA